MKEKESTKPVTEELHTYPAGRGKVLIIATRRTPRKKNMRRNPRFAHARIKSNPDDIVIAEYTNLDNIKRIILFPEARQLSHEERFDLAASLVATLPKCCSSNLRPIGKRYMEQSAHITPKYPHFISREFRELVKRKWKRYVKWRKKQE